MNPENDTSDTSSAVVGGAPSRRIVRRRGTRPDQNRVTRGTSHWYYTWNYSHVPT